MMEEWNKNRSLRPDRTELAPHTEDESAKRREREAKRKQKLDEQLDRGLEDTFPGSDPVAVTQPPHSARDKLDDNFARSRHAASRTAMREGKQRVPAIGNIDKNF